jgi:HlyD family secretion protein
MRQGNNDWSVFRVVDGRARLTKVSIGDGDDRYRVVVAGVAAGDRVVLFPGDALRDGDVVQVDTK